MYLQSVIMPLNLCLRFCFQMMPNNLLKNKVNAAEGLVLKAIQRCC